MAQLDAELDAVLRHERGRVIGGLLRLCGNLDAAEEAFQEAALVALVKWREQGSPENPGAWLMTVAKNHLRDARRHTNVAAAKAPLLREDDMTAPQTIDSVSDDHLRLILTCCHPELTVENQIALTLKVIAGFSTDAIARAFVCPEATISQRILRAKKIIEDKQLVYARAEKTDLSKRLVAVLGVIYLIFNEGHTSKHGELMQLDLQAEALRLGRLLTDLAPREPEVFGLYAIMAFAAARAHTRVDRDGMPLLLADQDRSRWDRELIRDGLVALQRARGLEGGGAYVLQAAIAAHHVTAASSERTDWQAIVRIYDALLELSGSPVVALNRAIAVSMNDGPRAGLDALAPLEADLSSYHLFYATRADFMHRAGGDARPDLARALELVSNDGERRLLERRLRAL